MKCTYIITLLVFASFTVFAQQGDGARPHRQGPWERFSTLDTDGDGRISIDEFSAGSAEMFNHHDHNGDGFLTQEDFPEPRPRIPGMLIRVADTDQSGDITAQEWTSFLAAISVEGSTEIDFEALHELIGERMGDHGSPRRPPHPPEGAAPFDTTALAEIFAELDADSDGALSASELPQPRHPGGPGEGGPHPGHDGEKFKRRSN